MLKVEGGEWGVGNDEGIPFFDISEHPEYIQFDDIDYVAPGPNQRPFIVYVTDNTSTRVQKRSAVVFAQGKEDDYIYTAMLVHTDRIYECNLVVDAQTNGKYYFSSTETPEDHVAFYSIFTTRFVTWISGYAREEGILWGNNLATVETVDPLTIKGIGYYLLDFSYMESTFNQMLSAVKQFADATPSVPVAKYVDFSGDMAAGIYSTVYQAERQVRLNSRPTVFLLINARYSVTTDIASNEVTFRYRDYDYSNNKIYDISITFAYSSSTNAKVIFVCTCHEATSLM